MTNPLLEEIYEIRAKIWKECGETIDGYFDYMSRPIPGVKTMPLPVRRPAASASKLPRTAPRARPTRAATRKKAART